MESAQPATVFCWLKHIVGIPNLPQFSEMGLAIPEALKEEEEHDDDDEDFEEEEEEEEEGKMDVKSFDSLNFFAEPLLDALSVGNESRNMQIGASMCLARVLDNVRFNPSPSLSSSSSSQRMCRRVLKLLNSPRFHAKAALLPAIAHIVQVKNGSKNK